MTKKVPPSSIPSYLSSPCDRCGSPKLIGRVWKENIETYSGKSTIEHTQILCSNSECQKEYDKQLAEEAKKREALRASKEASLINKKALAMEASKNRAAKVKNG